MPYANARDLQIYYELSGADDGPQLAFINGALGLVGPAGHWKYQIDAFSAAGFRVLTYEHRGHGRTNNPPGRLKDYEEFADDAIALFDALGFSKPHIAGLSDGAITALSLGMRYPQKVGALVVAGANYYQDEAILEILGSLTPEMIRTQFPEMAAELESNMQGRWEDLIAQHQVMFKEHPHYSLAELGSITAPTLVMAGDRDFLVSLDQTLAIYKAIPESELCVLPGAGHAVSVDSPELSTAVILDFFKGRAK